MSGLNAEIRFLERELIQSKIKLAQSKADLDRVNLEYEIKLERKASIEARASQSITANDNKPLYILKSEETDNDTRNPTSHKK